MELDEYKIAIRQIHAEAFPLKDVPGAGSHMRRRTRSVVDTIKKNLVLEIAFALLFLIFDGYIIIFSAHSYLRLFASLLMIFCLCFIYYLLKLLNFIRYQHTIVLSVKEQLKHYINIIHRFTRLYFQLTMVMVPLILFLAFMSGYLDNHQPSNLFLSFTSSQRLWIYPGLSALWYIMMYFFTKWYLKKLYGNHLNKLRQQLKELQYGD